MVTDAAEQVWIKTLTSLRSIFPWVGVAFLVRLVAICRALCHDVQDMELAEAVTVAYQRKRRFQKSEGLFIYTVPEMLTVLRNRPKPAEPAAAFDQSGVTALVSRVLMAVRARGAPFAPILPTLEDIGERVGREMGADEIFDVDAAMEQAEQQIIAVADGLLADADRAAVARRVSEDVTRIQTASMNPAQREDLTNRVRGQVILAHYQIPRLSLFYV